MPVAMIVHEPDGSQESYDKVGEQLALDGKPDGLIVHIAGPSPDGGWHVIDMWESEADASRFYAEQLTPALEAAGISAGSGGPRVWPVHNHIK
ncbi:MAG: hypothetical protein H0U25_06945 [Thermoleophilaceae bacterium]|nr:hypothetical protein [Thermoleophilaceae bacterium]